MGTFTSRVLSNPGVKDPYIKYRKIGNLWLAGVECAQLRN
jgi:hypothetical protein